MKSRQLVPDWIKGVAIILMVYGHATHTFFQERAVEVIYTFHMPLFLLISGFFFQTKSNPFELGKRLLSRVVRPYLIFISLYLIGLTLIQNIGIPTSNPPPLSLLDFLTIVFLHPRGAYWFLHSLILIQSCLILAGLVSVRAKWDESIALVITILLLAVFCTYNFLLPRTAVFFLVGIVLDRVSGTLPISLWAGLLMGVILWSVAESQIFQFSFMQIAWSLSILTFLAGVGRLIEGTSFMSIIAWCGRNSLIVLLVHALFIILLSPLSQILSRIDQTGLLYSAGAVVITMFGSILTAFCSDKLGISRFLFGVRTIYSELEPTVSSPSIATSKV